MAEILAYEHIILSSTSQFEQGSQIESAVNHYVNSGRNVTVKVHNAVVVEGKLVFSSEVIAVRRTLPPGIITVVLV